VTDHARTYPALDVTWPSSDWEGLPPSEHLAVALDDLDVVAIHELDTTWLVSFSSAEARDRAARILEDRFRGTALRVSCVEIADEGWAARNQADLRAVRIGNIMVAPPWDVAADTQPEPVLLIRIAPSMGFGTGHHATTRLCLRLLQAIDLKGRSFLDVGTGSGVLAVAACLLGARPVTAIDTDPDAIESARENVRLNGTGDVVRLVTGDFRSTTGIRACTVVANLTGAVVAQGRYQLRSLVEPAGILIVSGFGRDEVDEVLSALAEVGDLVDQREEEGWCAATVRVGFDPVRAHD
jgi:ribosomal protein L11 methyltransferase